jgi:serine phosphatase RsbU (regulator of sigma subunit)
MARFYFLISVLMVPLVSSLNAQQGATLLTNYNESREIEDQNWAITQDVNNVMLFANRKGISSFDGLDWISIRIPVIPYSMCSSPKDGKIFIGGENSYGFLEKDQSANYKYVPISGESNDIGIITKIIFNDSVVWFYGEESVSRHNLENSKLELRLKSDEKSRFSGMVVTPENTFINKLNSGLYRLESDTLFPIVTGYITEKLNFLFSLPYDNKRVLVGLSNGQLSLFDGIKYYNYQVKDDGYLKENILSDGITIGDSLYAFSTLDGGALVIDKKTGAVRFTLNNQNKLPDDEIFAIGSDRAGGLWLSHQYGLSRAGLNLPIGEFSIYPGLKGNLTTSLWYNNELYVGTSEGVFYLTTDTKYSEVPVMVKNYSGPPLPVRNDPATGAGVPFELAAAPQGPDVPRKNIFTRIFGKKSPTVQKSNAGLQTTTAPVVTPVHPVETYTRKTVKKLKSIDYIYKKVDGFNEKCRQLVNTKNGILAATNKGLLVINNYKAELLADNRYINFISWEPADNRYYIAAEDGYFSVSYVAGKWVKETPDPLFTDPVYSVVRTSENSLWLGVDNAALRADISSVASDIRYTRVSINNDYPQKYLLDFANDSLFLYTESGIFSYNSQSAEFIQTRIDNSPAGVRAKYLYPLSNMPWIRHGFNWIYLSPVTPLIEKETSLLKLANMVVSINTENNILWVVDDENRLFRIDMDKLSNLNPESNILIKSVYDEAGTSFSLSDIVLQRGDNIIYFDIIAPSYLKQNTTQYQYTINKLMSSWSPWSVNTNYNIPVSTPGEYQLQVRAKDIWGNIGEPKTIKFTIKAPFTHTSVFFILMASVSFLILFLIIRFREGQLQKTNKILEQKVKERTAKIEAQKEEITSSIAYASRIQMAMLPEEHHFTELFSDHFIIFKPRDIVSGDFYWIGENEKNIFFAVADCTGHGVPGAFMSTLGMSTLNEIITNNNDLQASKVLTLLRDKIKNSLHQTGKEGEAADGMDMALCVLQKNRKILHYSGAFNPLFIFQNGQFKEYKANRMPIGIYYGEHDVFTNYEINVKKGDTVYIFSDGYYDQFGGPEGSKYKKACLKKLLSENYYRPMSEQKAIFEMEFEKWKGKGDQLDDVTLIGIRF